MAVYYELLELLIEEPELFGPKASRVAFISSSKPRYIDPGDGAAPTAFGPGLLSIKIPGRATDLYQGGSSLIGVASGSISLESFPAVELLKAGVRFQKIRARFYWWREGQTLTEAQLLWNGLLRSPIIDPTAGTFSFTAAAGTREIDVEFPPGLIGDEGRFATDIPNASKPIPMPVVYGIVRNLPIYAIQDDTGGAGTIRFLIAGHKIPYQALRVRGDNGTVQGLTFIGFGTDGLGRAYSYIDVAAVGVGFSAGAALYVDGQSAGQSAPGDALGAVGASPAYISGLGDMLIHAVSSYGREQFFDIDRRRVFAAREPLNRFQIGMWFNAQQKGSSFLQILKSRFEQQFPVSFSYVGGLFGWDYTGAPDKGLESGSIVWRQNANSRTPLRLVNIERLRSEFAVHYGGDGHAAGAVVPVTRGPENSQRAKRARTRWGNSKKLVLQAPDVTNDFSARLLLEDQIIRLTKRRSRISYIVEEPEWLGLPLLSRVLVTDSDFGWTKAPFLIEGLAPEVAGRVTVNLISEGGL